MAPLSSPGYSLDRTLLRMLLLSLALHLAVLMIVQPTRVREMAAAPPITAKLLDPVQPDMAASELQPVIAQAPRPTPLPVRRPDRPEAPTDLPVEPMPAQEDAASPVQAPQAPLVADPVSAAQLSSVVPDKRDIGIAAPSAPAKTALPDVPAIVDPTWYEVRQLDVQPRALRPVEPVYPGLARRRGVEGSVKLMLKIDEFGVVQEAAVEAGEPPGVFDAAALEAFRQARFAPAKKNQRPVRALVYVRVVFRLE